jgi:Co/Zn/Cd efflux system component
MKMFADNMEALDKFFEHKKPSESYLIIVGVAGIIGLIAYMLFLPYTQSEYETSKAQKLQIKKNIN